MFSLHKNLSFLFTPLGRFTEVDKQSKGENKLLFALMFSNIVASDFDDSGFSCAKSRSFAKNHDRSHMRLLCNSHGNTKS